MHQRFFAGPLMAATILVSACVVPEGATPSIDLGVDVASRYVHRGMVQNEKGVLQPHGTVVLPAKKDGAIVARTWANMDLSNDTGDAWLPNGHAGKFSQIDYNLFYVQNLDELSITSGFITYNLPNGLEFPFGERGQTSEFMVEGVYALPDSWLSIQPFLAVHYDFDEVTGFYIRGGAAHTYEIDDKTRLTSELGIAWMDQDMAFWNFSEPRNSGLSDATLRATVDHDLDPHTSVTGFVAYSTVVDSDFRDWFDLIGIDTDQLYAGVGVRWSY